MATPSGTIMPRGRLVDYVVYDFSKKEYERFRAPDWVKKLGLDASQYRDVVGPSEPERKRLERFRLYSPATRQYMRRRAWRYFRRLGKAHPERYVAAISEAMALYDDADVGSGLALIDNWGLVHAAVPRQPGAGRSPSRLATGGGSIALGGRAGPDLRGPLAIVAQGDLRPDGPGAMPAGAAVGRPDARARAGRRPGRGRTRGGHRPARARRLRGRRVRGRVAARGRRPLFGVTRALAGDRRDRQPRRPGGPGRDHGAADRARSGSRSMSPPGWPPAVPCRWPGSAWAGSRPRARPATTSAAACWPCSKPSPSLSGPRSWPGCDPCCHRTPEFHADWLLEFLDSRHADARAEGMSWFRAEARARDDVVLWHRLMESPHDDVRLALAADLDARLKRAKGDGSGRPVTRPGSRAAPAAMGLGPAERPPRRSGQAGGRRTGGASPWPSAGGGRGAAADAGGGPALAPGSRAPRGPGRRRAAGRAPARIGELRSEVTSRVAMGLSVCDHDRTFDPEGGRAGARDHHAAAIRRGRT